MEQKRNIILRGAEMLSRGSLDNVALQDGAIVLDEIGGQHVLYGCYTSPEIAMPAFCNLNMSWNADTPKGTVVEAQCRVYAGGEWSGWKSFGKWSPDYPRRSVRAVAGESGGDVNVFVIGDMITVAVPGGGSALQMRVFLYTDDERTSPVVRLLAAAVRPLQWQRQTGVPINRMLYLPEYDVASHDPSFGASMDLPLTVAALLNHYGEDVLPEEVAYMMSDGATADCRNAAYAAAAAGACAYECYQAWVDLKDLRSQIRQGFCAAVELERPGARDKDLVWMGLRGFGHDEAVHADYVQLNDPSALRGSVSRTMAVTDFERYFTGRALILHRRPHGVHGCRPLRRTCSLKAGKEPGTWDFEYRGEPDPLAEDFDGWLALTPRGGPACATTAHRSFHRIAKSLAGGIRLPEELRTPGARYTVYAVDETGALRVAELRLPGVPPRPAPPAPAKEPSAEGKAPAVS